MRAPVADGSVVDLVVELKNTTVEEINAKINMQANSRVFWNIVTILSSGGYY